VRDVAHQERSTSIDFLGNLLLASASARCKWMLERGERYDWFESRFVTVLALTSLHVVRALIWRELTIDEPVIDFRVLKSRAARRRRADSRRARPGALRLDVRAARCSSALHGLTREQTAW
jgi:hypothetical protein